MGFETTSKGLRSLRRGLEPLPKGISGLRHGLKPVPRNISGQRRGVELLPRPFPAGDGAWNHFHGRFRPETIAKHLSTGGGSRTIRLSLRMRTLCLLSLKPANPKIIAGEGKRGSDQRREEAEQTGDGSAPAAHMPGIDPAMQFRGTRLLRVGLAVAQLSTARVEGVAIARTQAVASLGHDIGTITSATISLTALAAAMTMTTLRRGLHPEKTIKTGAIPTERPGQAGQRHGQQQDRRIDTTRHMQVMPEAGPSLGERDGEALGQWLVSVREPHQDAGDHDDDQQQGAEADQELADRHAPARRLRRAHQPAMQTEHRTEEGQFFALPFHRLHEVEIGSAPLRDLFFIH